MKIVSTGSAEVPAILALESMGLAVTSRVINTQQDMIWEAKGDGNEYAAEDPIALLGLVKLLEMRGENWRASDAEIDKHLPILEGDA